MLSPVSNWSKILLILPKDDPAWSRGEEEDRTKFQHWLHLEYSVLFVDFHCSVCFLNYPFIPAISPTERPSSKLAGRIPSKLLVKADWWQPLVAVFRWLSVFPFAVFDTFHTLDRWDFVRVCFKVSKISLYDFIRICFECVFFKGMNTIKSIKTPDVHAASMELFVFPDLWLMTFALNSVQQ